MASAYEKIQQAKREYEAAKKKGNVNAMAAAHIKADQARNYNTVTKADDKGRLYQAPEIIGGTLKPEPVKKLPPATTAARVRTGTLPKAPTTQMVDFTLPMGKTIQVEANMPKKNVLADAFDKKENYIDKFKKGNIGGGVANVVGTGLTGLQTLYLNTANTVDSVAQGKGLPKYQPMMDFTEYDKVVAERRGAKPTIEKAKDINPALGTAYQFLGEVGTDPLELTPMGYLNDIKMAKGFKPNTASYMAALQSGKLNPTGVTATLPRATTPAPQPRVLPVAKTTPVPPNAKNPTTKGLKPNIEANAYHGSPFANNIKKVSDIKKSEGIQDLGQGLYFTKNKEYADTYAHQRLLGKELGTDSTNGTVNLNTDNLKIKNINEDEWLRQEDVFVKEEIKKSGNYTSGKEPWINAQKRLQEKYISEGYDGLYIIDDLEGGGQGIVFPESISKVSRANQNTFKGKPQPLPQTPTKPVQPILPQKGTEIPKEQPFAKNRDLPTKKIDNAPKTETYKKALYETAINEYDKTVASVEDYISKYKPKGVDIGIIPKNGDELMRDGGIRYAASKNDQWYQEYYKANGRKPSKAESREIAEKLVKESLKYGNGEFYNPDLGSLFNELKGLRSVGADTFKGEKTIDDLVNEFGAMRKGEMPRAREVDIPKKTDYGQTQRYARTLQESAIVDDTLFKDINEAITQGSFTKPTKGNKAAVDDASRTITDEGLDEAVSKFKSVLMSDKKPTSYDIALGNRTLQELQKVGRYDEALDVAIDLSEMLSESGRTLQAARIAKRLSPEGRLMIASRVASKVSKKTGNKVKLSDDTVKLISEAKTEKEVVEANQKAAVEIWNQAPPNWIDKVNSWRYMSMLFNPKTHMRNIVGNALFVPAREFKNLIGAGLERALIKDGVRTKAVLNPARDKVIMDFASKDFQNVKAILKNEGKLDDHVRNLDAKVFNFKPLEGVRRLNLNALDAEDTWFMKFAYDSSLAQYMKANKLTPDKMMGETLESARKYAMNESLKATYRDFNALATIISRGKHTLASGKYGPLGKAGGIALEGMIPFTKTPLNIVKRGVGYSPANLVRGIANLGLVKSGKVTATEAIDQLASGLSGTALLGLGTALGYNNIVSGKEGEYKDKLYNYNQMLGSQNYSLNIDGKSYTLDWAAPLSMPFFVGVEISKAIKDNNADLATVLDAMTQISDPMVNLSMLKGINDIMTNNFEGIGQTAFDIGTGYAGQFNPTVLGQISRTADPLRRSTISTAETGTLRGIEKFGRKQLAKIPFASKSLEPYVDLWGREQKNGNFVENFLSPGYFKSENVTKVDEELKSLVGKLDEETANKILPTSKAYQYTIQSAGLPYRMTEKESTAYQKTRGRESYKGLNKLFASIDYRKMSQEDKVKAIQDVYSDAHDKAKYDYFDSKGLPVTLALDKDYQEKYQTVKGAVSDKQFYSAVQSVKGKSTNIEKAYALAGKPDKVLEVFGIDTQAKEGYVPIMQKVDELRQSGIAANDYIKAKQAADMNASGNISKSEATAYLDTRSDLTQEQKAAILQALVPALKTQNNPYY